MDEKYLKQVELVVKVLNHIEKENSFALKGGTAINLFYNNLHFPRQQISHPPKQILQR